MAPLVSPIIMLMVYAGGRWGKKSQEVCKTALYRQDP